MIINCAFCNKEVEKSTGHANRANKLGLKMYCDRKCSGLNKQTSLEEKKRVKAEYDKKYRAIDPELFKIKRHEYFKRTYDPKTAAIERKKKMHKHIEYCRTPQYKEWKKQYDLKHQAKKHYGEFWESALLIKKIEEQYDQKEVRQINNLHNKSQKRKRKWKQLQSKTIYAQRT